MLSWDPLLVIALILLSFYGLAILYSAAGPTTDIVTRQAIHFSFGLLLLLLIPQLSFEWLRSMTPAFYGLSVLLVALVLQFGYGKGVQRWFDLGLFSFQPSEMVKITLPMMVAWWVSLRPLPPSFLTIVVALALIVFPTFLIYLQPDFGTAILVFASGMFVLFFTVSWGYILFALASLAVVLPTLWHFVHPYQRERLVAFLDPEADPLGKGYHIIQSKIAIGSGGWSGKGWREGTQSQLDFLPEQSTDFILAALGEEFGFVGVLVLLALYLVVAWRGFVLAMRAEDPYARLLISSITLTFLAYCFVNMSMVMGLLPVVGMPLPMLSYGGTSMVTLMIGFGMIMCGQSKRFLS